MAQARIYQPARTAMQAGWVNTRKWVLEFESEGAKRADPLMGWIGSADTRGQVRLKFDSRDEAVDFAKRNALTFEVYEPRALRVRPKIYADNFRYGRVR